MSTELESGEHSGGRKLWRETDLNTLLKAALQRQWQADLPAEQPGQPSTHTAHKELEYRRAPTVQYRGGKSKMFYVYRCFASIYACAPGDQKRATDLLELEMVVSHICVLGINTCPLEGQPVLLTATLTTEPSL